jgi:hypothetical protein
MCSIPDESLCIGLALAMPITAGRHFTLSGFDHKKPSRLLPKKLSYYHPKAEQVYQITSYQGFVFLYCNDNGITCTPSLAEKRETLC